MTHEATLDYARARDETDPLSAYRERFALPRDEHREPLVYLCGHSLGLMPLAARELVSEELDDWAGLGVLGHEHARRPWIPYHENLTAGLAYLTGARMDEVVAMNSLTVNLHLMLASFYRPAGARTKILVETGAFSSDRHAIASQLAWHGLDPASALLELAPSAGEDGIAEQVIESCLERHGAQIALVLWPGVQFRIHDHEADFAVWCSYKFLNAGPGAIGGCFIHERHTKAAPAAHLAGWWGHEAATRFRMEPEFRAAAGAAGWQISNPPILSAAPLIASLAIFREARLERLREKSVALTGFLEYLIERMRPDARVVTPPDLEARGCQLSVRISGDAARGQRVFSRLGERGVVCDWRDPDVMRIAPVPLYNRFEDVFRFAEHLAEALRETA